MVLDVEVLAGSLVDLSKHALAVVVEVVEQR